MKAVVMAGGEGSRLRPLTSRRPKPLAPIANRPVMQHIVDLLRKHGVTEIVATLHYLADEIESYFGDGSAFVNVPNASSYPAVDNKFNAVSFDPVTTTKLRVSLQSGQGSVGVIQWVVPSIPSSAPRR